MVVARACANIALVKYWGKRDDVLNLPAAGSFSLTLAALETVTRVELIPGAQTDHLVLDGREATGRPLERVSRFVEIVRTMADRRERVQVVSSNRFPTAGGLASSASAFAALAVASLEAFGLRVDARTTSCLARRGSGSAARSVFGGFCRMNAGCAADGSDAFAEPFEGSRVELAAAIAVVEASKKEVASTDGMDLTRRTSPYHDAWLSLIPRDLTRVEAALRAGDIEDLAETVEGNCLAMHADAMAARPGILYFRAATLWAIEEVRSMRRREAIPVFFTIDAGPHVVAFTLPEHVDVVAARLSLHPEVRSVIRSQRGEGAHLTNEDAPLSSVNATEESS